MVGLALIAGACSNSNEVDPASLDPTQAESCPQLVDVAIAMVENAQEEQNGLSAEEIDSLRGVLYADLKTVADRAGGLGCANAASRVFRRALGNLSPETSWDGELIVDAATFDPFRNDAAIEQQREPSLLVTDFDASLDEVQALAESLASGYANDGANPVDWIDIDSDFGAALYVKWIVEPDWAPLVTTDYDTAVLVLADHGVFDRADIPVPGTADVLDWPDTVFVGDDSLFELVSGVKGEIRRGFNRALFDDEQD